jgi:SAM-dependent methyltransferase
VGEIFRWERPARPLPFTGERFTSETSGQIEIEHLHRYFLAREFCRDKDVLDIASGEGYGSALIAQVARSVVAVDVDAAAVTYAGGGYSRPNLWFVQGDARAIPLATASVDVVSSFETIEHIYEQDVFIAEVRRVLRPSGIFIVSTPNRDVYSPPDSPANPFHLRELTVAEFEQALRQCFEHVECLSQRPMLGSTILPNHGVTDAGGALTFERRGDDYFERSVGLPRAPYAIALASGQPIAAPPPSSYIETSAVDGRRDHLETQSAGLASELQVAVSENERLEKLFGEARSENDRLETLFGEARSENERLEALLAEGRSYIRQLQAQLSDTEERSALSIAEARADAAKLKVTAEDLSDEKHRIGLDLADTRAALARAATERDGALRSFEEISARLHTIETSGAWRLLTRFRRLWRFSPSP